MESTTSTPARKLPLYRSLYVQVITAVIIGVLLGHFYPAAGEAMKPLGDGFIKLIKMIIAPIIFCTVVVGIAKILFVIFVILAIASFLAGLLRRK